MKFFVLSLTLLVGLVNGQQSLNVTGIADLPQTIIDAIHNEIGDDYPDWLQILTGLLGGGPSGADRDPMDKPNIVLLIADDMGYGDLTSYGHPSQEPGFIDELAVAGLRFTNGYVGDSVCTPSRSAIMTGRLPIRTGVYGNTRVFLPWTKTGLPKSEVTIAEAVKASGYTTGMIGKWHLGINENSSTDGAHLPYNHGFDFVGHNLPFGNSWACDDTGLHMDFPRTDVCYLYNNATLVSQPFEHRGLTQLFTQDAVGFIENNVDNPFFLYMAFAHMHTSLFSSDDFSCSSRRGRYGDNLNELHSGVETIVQTLRDNELEDNTIVFFISDHGPHREYCEEGGSANVFQGGKSLSWEGGHRIPYIVYWPGMVTPGVSHELVTSMDIIVTAADLAGSSLPTDRVYDGKNIKDVILNGATSPHDNFFYYCKDKLMAVRVGKYKAHFRTQAVLSQSEYGKRCDGGFPIDDYFLCNECEGDCVTLHDPPLLFDIEKDPDEAYPLGTCGYEDVLDQVKAAIEAHEAVLVKGTSILDIQDKTKSIVPCCNKETNCVCNFDYKPGVPECYDYLLDVVTRHSLHVKMP
ncbi:arylsulfatase-like [Diadema antillarum]|uniref:arylsulfatase-like n=1 Tax=Diadema antillarum TaxID=105358 RepID=UPI003A8A658D